VIDVTAEEGVGAAASTSSQVAALLVTKAT